MFFSSIIQITLLLFHIFHQLAFPEEPINKQKAPVNAVTQCNINVWPSCSNH